MLRLFLSLLFLVCLAIHRPAAALETLSLHQDKASINLGPWVYSLEDTTDSLRLHDIQAMLTSARWQRQRVEIPNFGFGDSRIWLGLKVYNATVTPMDWLLEIGYPLLDDVQLYLLSQPPAEPHLTYQQFGDRLPFAQRGIMHRNFLQPLHLEPGETQLLLIAVKSSSSLQIPLQLHPEKRFFISDSLQISSQALYIGAILIMLLYNLLVHLNLNHQLYLQYLGFSSCYLLAELCITGLAYQFLWPNWPQWNQIAFLVFSAGSVAFGCFFSTHFLHLRDHYRFLHRYLRLSGLGAIAIAVFSPLMPYGWLAQMLAALSLPASLVALTGGLLLWRRGEREARYYCLGWTAFLLGSALLALSKLGIIARTRVTEHSAQIGSILVVLLLSLALADYLQKARRNKYLAQYRNLEQERHNRKLQETALQLQQEANQKLAAALAIQTETAEQLEQKVQERTRELSQTLDELSRTNQILANMNTIDPLTLCHNRRYFNEHLDIEWSRSLRERQSLSLLLIEIDYLNLIRDTYDQATADSTLQQVTELLKQRLKRPSDILARYSDDCFAVILLNTSLDGALFLGEQIRRDVELAEIIYQHLVLHVTLSIGGAARIPTQAQGQRLLLASAEQALFEAQYHGRNQIRQPTADASDEANHETSPGLY